MNKEEIEKNKESINTFDDVDILVDKWNKLYDKYFE